MIIFFASFIIISSSSFIFSRKPIDDNYTTLEVKKNVYTRTNGRATTIILSGSSTSMELYKERLEFFSWTQIKAIFMAFYFQ